MFYILSSQSVGPTHIIIYFGLMLPGAFEDPDIIHVDDTVDPVRDLEVITEELRLKV